MTLHERFLRQPKRPVVACYVLHRVTWRARRRVGAQ